MTVNLPYDLRSWPNLRLLTASQWGADWVEQPMAVPGQGAGYEILSLSRRALPEFGRAKFRYVYGEIDGKYYGFDADQGFILTPNLLHYEIRIQQQLADESWETIWWGHCLARQDDPFAAGEIGAGVFTYHCVEAIERTSRWILDRHQVYIDGTSYPGTDSDVGAHGHPGYNVVGPLGRLAGNKDDTDADPLGLGYVAHTWPGQADAEPWNDEEAVNHAIASARRYGDTPDFALTGATDPIDLLSGYNHWPIAHGENLLNFLRRVFDRKRARGLVFTDWTEASATGQLTPILRVRPQFEGDISETLPSGAAFSATGASSAGTAVTVDLEGDHRIGPDGGRFELVTEAATDYTGVITEGDPIVVVASLSEAAGLEQRWTAAEQTAWDGASAAERKANATKFAHVYALWGFPTNWGMIGIQGSTGFNRIDYRTNLNGKIVDPESGVGIVERDTSPLLIRILDEIPILAGFDYASDPARRDGTQVTQPSTLPLQVWRQVEAGYFIDAAQDGITQVDIAGNDIWLLGNDDADGERYWDGRDTANLVLTVALELPHRLRVGTILDERRVKVIRAPGLALHLAHSGAIWSLDETDTSSSGYAGLQAATGATQADPAILRDDRDALFRLHHLAAKWFTGERRTARWSLMDGGMAGSWTDEEGTSHTWPAIGDLVTDITASGRTEAINTPITSVEYDHVAGVTKWATSWSERDFR